MARRRDTCGSRSLRATALLLAMTTAMFACSVSSAATRNWQVYAGDWSTASNWGGTVPGSADTALIDNSGTASITQSNAICSTLTVGNFGTGSLTQTGGTNSVSANLYVGNF